MTLRHVDSAQRHGGTQSDAEPTETFVALRGMTAAPGPEVPRRTKACVRLSAV